MQALSWRSEPQKPVWSGWKAIIRGPHLTDTRQKSLTVKAMRSVTLLMHKVWKFITLHIITEHTKDPGALYVPLASVSLTQFLHPLILSLSHSLSVAKDDEGLRTGAQSSLYTSKPYMCHVLACQAE